MSFKVCSSCGKHVKVTDSRCWNCRSLQFEEELVAGEPGSFHAVNVPSVKCPKCGSEQFAAGTKGFGLGKAAVGGVLLGPVGLLGGLFRSKKVTITCLKCAHRWFPGT
jgi:DNA-directed RNA polymerase subunit RPC12/RpoP